MAVAVKLSTPPGSGGDKISVKGVAVEGLQITPRALQFRRTKFWGVLGESEIYGGYGQRQINIPTIIYDSVDFDTAEKLSDFIDQTLNGAKKGNNGTLEITSESDHDPFLDCTFEGFTLMEGPKHDEAGTLGGGYFAFGLLHFTQLS